MMWAGGCMRFGGMGTGTIRFVGMMCMTWIMGSRRRRRLRVGVSARCSFLGIICMITRIGIRRVMRIIMMGFIVIRRMGVRGRRIMTGCISMTICLMGARARI